MSFRTMFTPTFDGIPAMRMNPARRQPFFFLYAAVEFST
jgi:hypothetical protein